MEPKAVGQKLYSPENIVRSFQYYATSRSLYRRLRMDLQLASERTLQRLTSTKSKLTESEYVGKIMTSINPEQKECIIMHDEVYVKKMLLYSGGTVYGRALDDPSKLAKTMLGVMIQCLMDGPAFLAKMLPIANLKADFLANAIAATKESIEQASGKVTAIICDGTKVNTGTYMNFIYLLSMKAWWAGEAVESYFAGKVHLSFEHLCCLSLIFLKIDLQYFLISSTMYFN